VVGAIKAGAVKRFFFIGGCDGTEGERNYFAELAKASLPDDAMILTAGCAKFRFNRLLEGKKVGPFPKVLDMGQCNDISGAIAVAVALAGKLGCKVGDLPLEFAVSWLEQKAVSQLLTCLHLGLKGIKLGPNLPAFITPTCSTCSSTNFSSAPPQRRPRTLLAKSTRKKKQIHNLVTATSMLTAVPFLILLAATSVNADTAPAQKFRNVRILPQNIPASMQQAWNVRE
jgi:hypothetical protein